MGRTLPAALGSALDEALMRPILTEVFQDLLGPGARIAGVRSEIVKHRTVRYTVALEGEATPSWRVIGKVYETRAAAEGEFAALRWMWTQGFSMRPPLSITLPRALALLPDQELLLMEEAGGRSLKRLLHAGTAGPAELRAFAARATRASKRSAPSPRCCSSCTSSRRPTGLRSRSISTSRCAVAGSASPSRACSPSSRTP